MTATASSIRSIDLPPLGIRLIFDFYWGFIGHGDVSVGHSGSPARLAILLAIHSMVSRSLLP